MGDAMRKGELTRERIVAEAAPIFNRQGFAGSSMQDVMEATGLEKGGLYRHFRSKEELAAESFRYALAQAVKLRTDKVDRSHGVVEHLQSIVKRFVETPSAVPGGCTDDDIARLTEAFVALDTPGLAGASCQAWKAADPQASFDPNMISPKIVAACSTAEAAKP